MPDPTAAKPLMEPSRSIGPDDLSNQLTEAVWSCTPLFRPQGPRPMQACLYSAGEVFYVDPAVLDRLESRLFMEYAFTPAQEINEVDRNLAAAKFAYLKKKSSPYSFNACW
jgi:hypothetical protein